MISCMYFLLSFLQVMFSFAHRASSSILHKESFPAWKTLDSESSHALYTVDSHCSRVRDWSFVYSFQSVSFFFSDSFFRTSNRSDSQAVLRWLIHSCRMILIHTASLSAIHRDPSFFHKSFLAFFQRTGFSFSQKVCRVFCHNVSLSDWDRVSMLFLYSTTLSASQRSLSSTSQISFRLASEICFFRASLKAG